MAYCTLTDLQTRFGVAEILQLADRDGNGVLDSGVVEAAIADATSEINGYLTGAYSLPLLGTPEMLVRIACNIARYRLMKDRAIESARIAYEDEIKVLRDIARGIIKLPEASGTIQNPASDCVMISRPAVFGELFNTLAFDTPLTQRVHW